MATPVRGNSGIRIYTSRNRAQDFAVGLPSYLPLNCSIASLKCGNFSVISSGIQPSIEELPQQATTTAMGTSVATCR